MALLWVGQKPCSLNPLACVAGWPSQTGMPVIGLAVGWPEVSLLSRAGWLAHMILQAQLTAVGR